MRTNCRLTKPASGHYNKEVLALSPRDLLVLYPTVPHWYVAGNQVVSSGAMTIYLHKLLGSDAVWVQG